MLCTSGVKQQKRSTEELVRLSTTRRAHRRGPGPDKGAARRISMITEHEWPLSSLPLDLEPSISMISGIGAVQGHVVAESSPESGDPVH